MTLPALPGGLRPLSGLCRTPTPLESAPRLGAALGVELWIKRDDLTGFGLSGNKVRKLRWLLAEARAQGADCVLTTGGLQSNHARATALAARRLGMQPRLLLRGTEARIPDANLLLDHLAGADIRTCTADDYRDHRDALLAAWAQELRDQGHVPYVIPEGGSNGLGALGFVDAAAEVADQADALRLSGFDGVICAVGSGGTLAGLALGPTPGPVLGIAVCDDEAIFTARVQAIATEARSLGGPALPPPGPDTWRVVDTHKGPAYGVATDGIWDTIRLAARTEGLLLDPVYTGKALHALRVEAAAGAWRGRWLFWHTGGGFGLFGRGAEVVGPAAVHAAEGLS